MAQLLIIGDSKGPVEYSLDGAELWSLERQRSLPWQIVLLLPVTHYARKNLGYLVAIERGASCIYETDDDNAPLPVWGFRDVRACAIPLANDSWTNVYRCFSEDLIWPRGFPLELIRDSQTIPRPTAIDGTAALVHAPIQQGLANNSPDVDAVWRLVLDREVTFKNAPSVLLRPGAWCPFNSQTTWWWPEAYPLLYLPSYCSSRMTDIWRSFVAQRCLWETGNGVVFHAPEVCQERNLHSLVGDFDAEIPGYLRNAEIARALEDVHLAGGIENAGDNLIRCYEALVRAQVFPLAELPIVKAWQSALEALTPAKSDLGSLVTASDEKRAHPPMERT